MVIGPAREEALQVRWKLSEVSVISYCFIWK